MSANTSMNTSASGSQGGAPLFGAGQYANTPPALPAPGSVQSAAAGVGAVQQTVTGAPTAPNQSQSRHLKAASWCFRKSYQQCLLNATSEDLYGDLLLYMSLFKDNKTLRADILARQRQGNSSRPPARQTNLEVARIRSALKARGVDRDVHKAAQAATRAAASQGRPIPVPRYVFTVAPTNVDLMQNTWYIVPANGMPAVGMPANGVPTNGTPATTPAANAQASAPAQSAEPTVVGALPGNLGLPGASTAQSTAQPTVYSHAPRPSVYVGTNSLSATSGFFTGGSIGLTGKKRSRCVDEGFSEDFSSDETSTSPKRRRIALLSSRFSGHGSSSDIPVGTPAQRTKSQKPKPTIAAVEYPYKAMYDTWNSWRAQCSPYFQGMSTELAALNPLHAEHDQHVAQSKSEAFEELEKTIRISQVPSDAVADPAFLL